jgi:hypothetical protein
LCLADDPLASGFALTQGQVSFKVPQVKSRKSYIVVRAYHHASFFFVLFLPRCLLAVLDLTVMGDSGNTSDEFTIKKCKKE